MALSVDIIDRRGPSNEMCHQLQPKEDCISHLYSSLRRFTHPSLLAKWSALVLKVGFVVRMEIGKMHRQL